MVLCQHIMINPSTRVDGQWIWVDLLKNATVKANNEIIVNLRFLYHFVFFNLNHTAPVNELFLHPVCVHYSIFILRIGTFEHFYTWESPPPPPEGEGVSQCCSNRFCSIFPKRNESRPEKDIFNLKFDLF